MWHGAHMANGLITDADARLFWRGQFNAAKLMWYADPESVLMLADRGAEHFMVRLPDSTLATGRIPSYQDYARECVETVQKFYDTGITDYQLDNEPNLQAWGAGEYWEYQWYIAQVITEMRSALPRDVRIGLAPLAWTALSDELKTSWLNALIDVAKRCDFVCVNSYWQSTTGTSILWEQFGGNAAAIARWLPKKPVVVAEYGTSISARTVPPAPPPEAVEALMTAQYPIWLAWARSVGYIEAAYAFILGGTDDWSGFRLTDPVVKAMRGGATRSFARASSIMRQI